MRYDYHVWADGHRWGYDIYDLESSRYLEDSVEFGGVTCPECIEESRQTWTNEETAERNAVKRIKELESK